MQTPTDGPAVRDLPPLRPLLSTPEDVTVHGFKATGIDEAITWWEWLRAIHPETRLWPLIVPANFLATWAEWFARLREHPREPPEPPPESNAVARLAAGIPPEPPAGGWADHDGEWPPPTGPDAAPPHIVMTDRRVEPRPLLVAMVPAATGPDVFEVLHFGGFNDCPWPAEHAAIARRWHDRWGADLLAMSGDSLEYAVSRPPSTWAEARELAAEFMVYDSEADDPEDLARDLLNSRWWAAWWD